MSDNYSNKLMTRAYYRASCGWMMMMQVCEKCDCESTAMAMAMAMAMIGADMDNSQTSRNRLLISVITYLTLHGTRTW